MNNKVYCLALLLIIFGCERKHSPPPTIVLPETYQKDIITLKMDLADGFTVAPEDPFISMNFRGFEPRPLTVTNTNTNTYITYKVYVDAEGGIKASLKEDLYVVGDGTGIADVNFTHGVGTIPERADEAEPMTATLRDLGNAANAVKNTGPYFFYFENAHKLLPSENVELSISYGQDKFVFPQKLKLKRHQISANFDNLSNWWNPIPTNKVINIDGGCFLPGETYRVKLENTPEKKALWVAAKYLGPDKLQVTIPSNVGNGNYYVSIFEDKNAISSTIYTISNKDDTKGFQRVWTNKPLDTEFHPGFFEPVKAGAGEEIFISPFPILTGTFDGPKVTADKLPALKITGAQGSFEIFPKVREDRTYGDGALVLFYGAYTLPSGIKPGKYQLQLHFKDSGISGPFCKELEVK
jgi:hypothetical protein